MTKNKITNDIINLGEYIHSLNEIATREFLDTEQPDVSIDKNNEDIKKHFIPEYDVIVDSSLHDFCVKVNEMLSEGWNIAGGISAVHTNSGVKFYQAIEKSKEINIGLNIPGLEDEPNLYEDII